MSVRVVIVGDRVEVEMYAPREDFIYRPFAVAEPYGGSRVMRNDLADPAERCGASCHRATIGSVDGDAQRIAIQCRAGGLRASPALCLASECLQCRP